jgi:hypothetical protein
VGALGPGWAFRPRKRVWPEGVKREIALTKEIIKVEEKSGEKTEETVQA